MVQAGFLMLLIPSQKVNPTEVLEVKPVCDLVLFFFKRNPFSLLRNYCQPCPPGKIFALRKETDLSLSAPESDLSVKTSAKP